MYLYWLGLKWPGQTKFKALLAKTRDSHWHGLKTVMAGLRVDRCYRLSLDFGSGCGFKKLNWIELDYLHLASQQCNKIPSMLLYYISLSLGFGNQFPRTLGRVEKCHLTPSPHSCFWADLKWKWDGSPGR